MAFKINYLDGLTYTAADDVAPWASLLTDGIYSVSSGAFLVTAHSPSNLSVDVAIGSATKNGYYIKSDSVVNMPIVANTSGYNRIDIIVLEVDIINKVTNVKAVQGTPNSSPTAPLPTANQLALAQIFVGNNVSVINTGNITDARKNVDLFGSQLADLANPKICKVYKSANQSITSGVNTALAFDKETWDTDNMHDNTTNNTRLTAKTAGIYHIIGSVEFAANATGMRSITLSANNTTNIAVTQVSASSSSSTNLQVSTDYRLNVGDYIELFAYQSSGSSLSVDGGTNITTFSARMVSN